MVADLRSTLIDLFAAFQAVSARVVLVGGVAVTLQGVVRATGDIDLVADLRSDEAARVISILTDLGFIPLPPVRAIDFADPVIRREWIEQKNLRVLSFARDGRPPLVDLFVEEPIPFAKLWTAADIMDLGNVELRVASLDHLIQMKRAAGRPHDLGDVDDLLSIKALRENEGRLRDAGGWDAPRRYYHASCLVLSPDERLELMLELTRLPEHES
jgi:hypothetical protein